MFTIDQYWRTMLLVEMITRTAKCEIRLKLRNQRRQVDIGVESTKVFLLFYLYFCLLY